MVEIRGELIKDGLLESFRKKGKKRDRSVVVYFRQVGGGGGVLQERVNSCLLQRVWVRKGRRSGAIEWRMCDGMGSRGQVVMRAEVTKVRT